MNIFDHVNNCEIFQIIDGKQRLSTIFDFIDDKFTIILEDKEYLFSELPKEYKLEITHANIRYYETLDDDGKVISDDEKISWFKFLNFTGTPQDFDLLKNLTK